MGSLSDLSDPADFFGGKSSAAATEAQLQSSQAALGELQRQFDIQQEAISPFREQALPALGVASGLAGAGGAAAQQAALSGLLPDPGTEFANEQERIALLRNASAIGGLGGGNVRRALNEQGVAQQRQQLGTQFNRLSGLAGTAQTATGQLGQIGQQFSAGVSNQLSNQANAIAGGIQAQQAAKQNQIGTAVGILGMLVASDEAIKHDISEVSDEDCFNELMNTKIKTWRYNEEEGKGTGLNIGPMYQESPEMIKAQGHKALDLHNELWMMAAAMRHMFKVIKNG